LVTHDRDESENVLGYLGNWKYSEPTD